MSLSRPASFASLACGATIALGCGSSPIDTFTTTPTLVAVSANDFRGAVPCAAAPGAMRSFGATLTDQGTTEEPEDFTLPSSVVADGSGYAPIRCEQPAAFAFVIPGHRYVGEVDAYDRSDLVALGPGSRHMVERSSGAYVAPRWTTRCGQGSGSQGPVMAILYRTRFLRGCDPLVDAQPSDTSIRISPASLLGQLECGEALGQVATLEATLLNTGAVQSAGCDEALVFGALDGGKTYQFEVFAFETGAVMPRWGTSCNRAAQNGALVDASCDPLSDTGTIEIDTQALAASLGTQCGPGGLSSVSGDIVAAGDPTTVPCGAVLRFSSLVPNAYSVAVTTQGPTGPGPSALCDVTVEPGVARSATCTAQ